MNKFWYFFIALLGITGLSIVPFLAGVEAERQFGHFNESFYPLANLKPVNTTYQRGWFASHAQTIVETLNPVSSEPNPQRFLLKHELDHGFVPIQSTLIDTTLHAMTDQNIDAITSGKELLQIHTVVQLNGDNVSTFTIPALTFKDNNTYLQWQGLQGTVFAKYNLAAVQAEIHSPQVQLQTAHGKLVIQNITFNADMQPDTAHFIQGNGSLNIANVQLAGKQAAPVKLAGITLAGNNQIIDDNLTISVKTGLQQIEVGTEHYGPSYGDFELHRWHIPTLRQIKNLFAEMRGQGVPLLHETYVIQTKLVPYGLALLKNKPEFIITRLSLNMPEGEWRGTLRVKMALFDGIMFAAFNPLLLLNTLDAQLEIHIPQAFLGNLMSDTSLAKPQTLKQYLKTWLDQEILVPEEAQPNYYHSKMQLTEGVLRINGQQLPLASIWRQN